MIMKVVIIATFYEVSISLTSTLIAARETKFSDYQKGRKKRTKERTGGRQKEKERKEETLMDKRFLPNLFPILKSTLGLFHDLILH